MGKYVNTSSIKVEDKNPTQIHMEGGEVVNPDKSGRVSLAHMKDGSRKWLYDTGKGKEEIALEDGFAVSTGQDRVPDKIGTFSGMGEGKLRKAYESEEDYQRRIKEMK